jgi:Ca2+:H+ antiporter
LAALGIFPLAALLVQATEQLATYTGDTIGGLLNGTFGNAPELIIALVALKAGLYDMVKASIIGAILANMLLGLGLAFLLGGYRRHVQEFNPVAARNYMTMMLLAVISLAIPSTFHNFVTADSIKHEQYVNLAVAVVLLATYGLSLVFMLKTDPDFFESMGQGEEHGSEAKWSLPRAVATLLLTSVFVALMSEILLGAVEETATTLGMSQAFIGIVVLAVVGGAAESSSAVAMGVKNRLDLSVAIAIGSSIQIALFVAPVLVLVSYFIAPQPLNLVFSRGLLGTVFLTVLIGIMVAGDGKANWFKGVQLITVYVIMAIMFYFLPSSR